MRAWGAWTAAARVEGIAHRLARGPVLGDVVQEVRVVSRHAPQSSAE